MRIDDETLMAFADGELAPDLAHKVAAEVERDPALADRLRRFSETRRILSETRDTTPEVDPALIARIRAATTAATTAATPAAATPTPANFNRAPLAAVAAVCALALVGIGWFGMPLDRDPADSSFAVASALDNLASGEGTQLGEDQELTLVASYRNGAGELCREYEIFGGALAPELRVACHTGGDGWVTRFSAVLGEPGAAYVPAEGGLESLDAFLSETGALAPMTVEEETSALSALAGGDDRG